MVRDVFKLVSNCAACSRRGTELYYQRKLELYPAAGAFEFVPQDILGPIPRFKSGIQFFVIMKDRYSKLTSDIKNKDDDGKSRQHLLQRLHNPLRNPRHGAFGH